MHVDVISIRSRSISDRASIIGSLSDEMIDGNPEMPNYLIATPHSAGPGCELKVVRDMLQFQEDMLSWGGLGQCYGHPGPI